MSWSRRQQVWGVTGICCLAGLVMITAADEEKWHRESPQPARPAMYTYFEPITPDWTGMLPQDHQDLLELWKSSWYEAGWDPIVLTAESLPNGGHDESGGNPPSQAKSSEQGRDQHSKQQHRHHSRNQHITWSQMLLRKWIAMSSRNASDGGWMCDYDVLPLFQNATTGTPSPIWDLHSAEFPATITLHEAFAPTLVVGTADAYRDVTQALLRHFQQHASSSSSFWTDSMALYELHYDHGLPMNVKRHVASADTWLRYDWRNNDAPGSANQTTIMMEPTNDPSMEKLCSLYQKRWVIHISPISLQRAASIPNEWRSPRKRIQLAHHIMKRQRQLQCHQNPTHVAS